MAREEASSSSGLSPSWSTRRTRIWLLPRGSRDDVQPFAALAVGLRKADFEVKVLAVGCYGRLFSAYGVPFEKSDTCLFWRNEEVVRQMAEKAAAQGLSGPEEYLDLLQQRKYEFLSYFTMKSWKDHTPTTKFMAWLNGVEATYNMLWRGRKDLDFADWSKWEQQRYEELLKAQAEAKMLDPKNLERLLDKQRQAYMASLRGIAKEHGQSLQEFTDLLHDEFNQYISRLFTSSFSCKLSGGSISSKVIKELVSFNSCLSGTRDLADYWAEWRQKLPGLGQLWNERSASANTKFGAVQVWNILAAVEELPPKERPDLVIYPPSMTSAALELRKQFGLNVLLSTTRPPCIQSSMQHMLYSVLTMEEKPTGIKNLQDMGPIAFSDLLRTPQQLFGIGPEDLDAESSLPKICKSSPEWMKSFRANLAGHWHLTVEQELEAAGEPDLFGGRQAKEQLDRFLAACDQAPIYIGFGSAPHPDGPEALAWLVVASLKLLNRRGIFSCSWGRLTHAVLEEALRRRPDPEEAGKGELEELGSLVDFAEQNVLFLRAAPHEWLFPRCACVVHHPSVGTTDAALRAGVPQVQTEAMGRNLSSITKNLIECLHVGKVLRPGHLGELEPRQVANTIQAVLGDAAMGAEAREVGAKHRERCGIARSTEYIRDGILLEASPFDTIVSPSGQVHCATDIYGRDVVEHPWAEGLYYMYTPKHEFGGRVEIHGCQTFVRGLDTPHCWLRAISDTEVEGFFQTTVDVAQLSPDGEVFKWGSGQEFHLRHFMSKSCEKTCECAVA